MQGCTVSTLLADDATLLSLLVSIVITCRCFACIACASEVMSESGTIEQTKLWQADARYVLFEGQAICTSDWRLLCSVTLRTVFGSF